jgi:hypothetical protein
MLNKNYYYKCFSFLFICFLTINQKVYAKQFNCTIKQNNEIIFEKTINSSLNNKILIAKLESITTYITEKNNHIFELESFIPNYEIRLYSEARLSESTEKITPSITKQNNLSSSLWGRDIMLEINCL